MSNTVASTSTAAARRPAIIYDSHCRFCIAGMRWIQKRDRWGTFEFVPREAPDLRQRFPQLADSGPSEGLRLVDLAGRVHYGADAMNAIARRLPWWRWWAWTYRLPGVRWLAQRLYAQMAKRRYALAGRCDESCAIGDVAPPS